MILLDWTRMGRSYCLAGVVREKGSYRVVRPLLAKYRTSPVRNIGWSPYLLDGHQRWEVFELLGPEPASPEPPHVEDCWVRAMRSLRRFASAAQRYEILTATMALPDRELFGAPLEATWAAAYLTPGNGASSLTTIRVPTAAVRFHVAHRVGAAESDVRVSLDAPGLAGRQLAVKDHHLLQRTEQAATDPERQTHALEESLRRMGDTLAVRLGLSRPFQARQDCGPAYCWVMADGFFSPTDPQC
jgi:hypothetical protein